MITEDKPRRLRLRDETTYAPPRSECVDEPRPCTRRCRYLLNGGLCSLDLAAEGPMRLAEIAAHFGVSKQRISQIESSGLAKLAIALDALETTNARKG